MLKLGTVQLRICKKTSSSRKSTSTTFGFLVYPFLFNCSSLFVNILSDHLKPWCGVHCYARFVCCRMSYFLAFPSWDNRWVLERPASLYYMGNPVVACSGMPRKIYRLNKEAQVFSQQGNWESPDQKCRNVNHCNKSNMWVAYHDLLSLLCVCLVGGYGV